MIDHLTGRMMPAAAHAAVHTAANPLSAKWLIVTFGLIGVFVILFAETGLLIGFFLPGDTLLALAGALAGPHKTTDFHLPLTALLIGCPIAAIVGAQVGHLIGVRGGKVLAKPGSSFEHSMRRIEPFLVRFGEGWAVFLCRFIPILRTFINPVVGILGFRAREFAFWNVLGGLIWTVSILLAGRFVGEKLHIDRYVLPVVGFVVVVSVLSMIFEVRRNRRRQAASRNA